MTPSCTILVFEPKAQALFDDWRTDLENRLLRTGCDSPMMAIHLGKYRSLMPTLALLFHLVQVATGRAPDRSMREHTLAGTAWCEYLKAHARRIYQSPPLMVIPRPPCNWLNGSRPVSRIPSRHGTW